MEMQILLAAYLVQSFLDIFTTGRPDIRAPAGKVFAALQVPMTTMLFFTLFFFSLAGSGVVQAGSKLAISVNLGLTLILGVVTLAISSCTAFQAGNVFGQNNIGVNIGLYVLYLGIPLVCSIAFAVTETMVLIKKCSMRPCTSEPSGELSYERGSVANFAINLRASLRRYHLLLDGPAI